MQTLVLDCWNARVLEALQDGIVDPEEIKILREMLTALRIPESKIRDLKAWRVLCENGIRELGEVLTPVVRDHDLSAAKERIDAICRNYGFDTEFRKQVILKAWDDVLTQTLDDGIVTEEEERFLKRFLAQLGLAVQDIGATRNRFVKGVIMREVLAGRKPQELPMPNTPVVLQKNEYLIWYFTDVVCREDRIRRQYVGTSAGLDLKLATRLSLQTANIRFIPKETTETVNWGTGLMEISNKHIFWISAGRSLKISLGSISVIEPMQNGIVIYKTSVSAKPLYFTLDDPWFACTLVRNLYRL